MIHASAIIDPKAELAPDVSVGAFSIIGAGVRIDEGTVIGPHVVIDGPTQIGKRNQIFQFASVGADKPISTAIMRAPLPWPIVLIIFCKVSSAHSCGVASTHGSH